MSRVRIPALGAVLVLAGSISQASAGASTKPPPPNPDAVVKSFLQDIGSHKISAAKSLMTQAYVTYTAKAADSLFTNVISMTHVTVGKVSYYGHRQANVPCNFVINQHRVGAWGNGPVTFGFQLTQTSAGSPWKIASGGTG